MKTTTSALGGGARVLVVDDHPLFCQGVAAALTREPGLTVVGTVATVSEALAELRRHEPDLVLLDHQLPDGDSIDACARMLDINPALKIIVVTMFDSPDLADQLLGMGARGFVVKRADSRFLLHAVRSVLEGRRCRDPELDGAGYGLSSQERRVLELVARGFSNGRIASRLHISPNTAKAHVGKIIGKLGAANRAEAAAIAVAAGIVSRRH